MKFQLKRYAKTIKDFAYSFIAYALPTMVLQFAVQPLIATRSGADDNGLFLSLFNAVKLCVSVLIVSMASSRLLDKKNCLESDEWDKGYNALFALVCALANGIMVGFSLFYRGANATLWDYLRLFAVVCLLCAHDFYVIAFRVAINYKNILIDNVLIVLGYGLGLWLFWTFGCWEYVFICGYAFGLTFVLLKTDSWKAGLQFSALKKVFPRYSQLCISSGLGNATVYCDRLLIYPMIGGYAVSVYNAAAVVSKVISIVTVPVRNVLLSYIVDKDALHIDKKTLRKLLLIIGIFALVAYGGLLFVSSLLCKLLYSQYFDAAIQYIPLILLGMVVDTSRSMLNVVILRFSKTSLQALTSGTKLVVYLGSVFLMVGLLKMDLLGFCLAILLADSAAFALVTYHFIKNVAVNQAKPIL